MYRDLCALGRGAEGEGPLSASRRTFLPFGGTLPWFTLCAAPRRARSLNPSSMPSPALAANVTLEGFQQTVATAVKNTGTTRVAVTELTEVSGARSNLGLLLTEELTFGLYSIGLKVVERSRVDAILKELNFQCCNLVDTKGTAREEGKIAGVDTIVIGSYTDLLDVIRVNLGIVLVETGEIVAGLSVNPERTKGIVMAMGPTANVATEGSTSFTAETGGRAESVFFKETFDSVREGDVPRVGPAPTTCW